MHAGTRLAVVLSLAAGCHDRGEEAPSGREPEAAAPETGGDTAAPALDATGEWTGSCAGDVAYDTGSMAVEYALALDLTDDGGDVSGAATITVEYEGAPVVTEGAATGSRDGDRVVLHLVDEEGYDAPVELRLVLDGDALTGDIVYFPAGTGGNPTFSLACALAR